MIFLWDSVQEWKTLHKEQRAIPLQIVAAVMRSHIAQVDGSAVAACLKRWGGNAVTKCIKAIRQSKVYYPRDGRPPLS